MSLASIYTYYNTMIFLNDIDDMFNTSIELNELKNNLKEVKESLFSYLKNPLVSNKDLHDYIVSRDVLEDKANEILDKYKENLMLKDIAYMSFSYIEETKEAEKAKRGRNVEVYSEHYNRSNEISGYIEFYIEELSLKYFENDTNFYKKLSAKLRFAQNMNVLLITISVSINILLVIVFTMRLRKPIITLSKSAMEISKGNFNVEEVKVETEDEMKIMADAFNKMVLDMKNHVDDIKDKAKLQKQLSEKELQNLEIKNLLKDAELKSLQSQINPHFLFNTLNAGMQIAMFEDADRTAEFIENLSSLFRYNLRKLNEPVSLNDEIKNVQGYIFLLKSRFGDKFVFVEDIEFSICDIEIPCLVLQPIIENSFIHGINEFERPGIIKLNIKKYKEYTKIEIEDNGKGMEKKVLDKIINKDFSSIKENKKDSGHTTGIGIGNVVLRLNLFYKKDNIFHIESFLDKGTKVILMIPNNKV
jgi:sensor histidine kinase YesM